MATPNTFQKHASGVFHDFFRCQSGECPFSLFETMPTRWRHDKQLWELNFRHPGFWLDLSHLLGFGISFSDEMKWNNTSFETMPSWRWNWKPGVISSTWIQYLAVACLERRCVSPEQSPKTKNLGYWSHLGFWKSFFLAVIFSWSDSSLDVHL